MKFLFHIGLLSLASCAVLDGYQDNQHAWFEKGLSTENKAEIQTKGYLYVEWNSPTTNGVLYITPKQGNPKNYNFVEIGQWHEESVYESNGVNRGTMKTNTIYDNHGNLLERKLWDKPKKMADYFLREEWHSSYQVTHTDTVLIQHVTLFYANGQKAWQYKLAIQDYQTQLSDRLKNKLNIDTAYHYNEQGELLETKLYKSIQ